MNKPAFIECLWKRMLECSEDELRVLDSILSGLETGRPIYGPLDLSNDKRDWQREADMEARDRTIYEACARLSGAK